MDGSYRWTNATVVNCHSRRFVGWTLSLGRNVEWSVCGWTDRQGTVTGLKIARTQPEPSIVSFIDFLNGSGDRDLNVGSPFHHFDQFFVFISFYELICQAI